MGYDGMQTSKFVFLCSNGSKPLQIDYVFSVWYTCEQTLLSMFVYWLSYFYIFFCLLDGLCVCVCVLDWPVDFFSWLWILIHVNKWNLPTIGWVDNSSITKISTENSKKNKWNVNNDRWNKIDEKCVLSHNIVEWGITERGGTKQFPRNIFLFFQFYCSLVNPKKQEKN